MAISLGLYPIFKHTQLRQMLLVVVVAIGQHMTTCSSVSSVSSVIVQLSSTAALGQYKKNIIVFYSICHQRVWIKYDQIEMRRSKMCEALHRIAAGSTLICWTRARRWSQQSSRKSYQMYPRRLECKKEDQPFTPKLQHVGICLNFVFVNLHFLHIYFVHLRT